MKLEYFYQCTVDVPLNNSFLTYKSNELLPVGTMVCVPLGKRKTFGIIYSQLKSIPLDIPEDKIRQIAEVLPTDVFLRKPYFDFFKSVAQYYQYPLGQLIFDCYPNPKNKCAKYSPLIANEKIKSTLNPIQAKSYEILRKKALGFKKSLLFGVTGSGKSFVYEKLIRDQLADGKSVLMLLPEINLTNKFIGFYQDYLPQGTEIYCYNSGITVGKKATIWSESAKLTRPALFIGARSAVYLPIKNLGLIIVDEEHDSSFKQMDRCPYWARDVASFRAKMEDLPLVMGSATPSFESFANAQKNSVNLVTMEGRYAEQALPSISLLSTHFDHTKKELRPISEESLTILKNVLTKNEQAIIFINRLGFSSFLQCPSCGHRFNCPNCDSSLRFFKKKKILSCSHCEHQEQVPKSCPKCWCLTLEPRGSGTEKVLEFLESNISEAKICRFDRENVKTDKKSEEMLTEFSNHKFDFLVGTQMIAKGHTFPRVNTVIVLGIDNRLNVPDFRAYELAFQQIVQVAGRAGRISGQGKVYVETHNKELPFWSWVKSGDYAKFYDHEAAKRQSFLLPPFSYQAHLIVSDKNLKKLEELTLDLKHQLIKQEKLCTKVQIIGPRPASMERKKNLYSWIITLMSADRQSLHHLIAYTHLVVKQLKINNFKLDIDPQSEA